MKEGYEQDSQRNSEKTKSHMPQQSPGKQLEGRVMVNIFSGAFWSPEKCLSGSLKPFALLFFVVTS